MYGPQKSILLQYVQLCRKSTHYFLTKLKSLIVENSYLVETLTLESLKMLLIKKTCVQCHFSVFLPENTEFSQAFTYKSTVFLIENAVRKKYCINGFCHLTTWKGLR